MDLAGSLRRDSRTRHHSHDHLHDQVQCPAQPGIDFTGGSILQYQFEKPAALETVREVLAETGFEGSQVQQAYISGKEVIVMRTKAIDDEAEKKKLDADLTAKLGEFKVLSVDKVSATVGPELLSSGLLSAGSDLRHDGRLHLLSFPI